MIKLLCSLFAALPSGIETSLWWSLVFSRAYVFSGSCASLCGWRYVKWLDWHPETLQKLDLGHSLTKWPGRRQLTQRPFERTNWSLCPTRSFLKSLQRTKTWWLLQKGHLAGSLIVTVELMDESGCLLLTSVWCPSFPEVAKLAPLLLIDLFESFLPTFGSSLMSQNTGWAIARAFASTNFAKSWKMISLCSLFVMSSALSPHLCLNGSGNLLTIFL